MNYKRFSRLGRALGNGEVHSSTLCGSTIFFIEEQLPSGLMPFRRDRWWRYFFAAN